MDIKFIIRIFAEYKTNKNMSEYKRFSGKIKKIDLGTLSIGTWCINKLSEVVSIDYTKYCDIEDIYTDFDYYLS